MLGRRYCFLAAQCRSAVSGLGLAVLVAAAGLGPRDTIADDYLDAIQGEATKLSEEPSSAEAETAETAETASVPDDPQAAFEQELKGRYRGSYLFYRKLPVKSQQEVFDAYEQGASIKEVRRIILDRFAHSR